jgi:hypothetical protein
VLHNIIKKEAEKAVTSAITNLLNTVRLNAASCPSAALLQTLTVALFLCL